MDELELLKKDWKKSEESYPKLSYDDIYAMIWKKSSSIVKWIFIISILEFVLWTFVAFIFKDSEALKSYEQIDANAITIPLMVIGYGILAYFFYLFWKNYRTISVIDNAKQLMENILRTRRTVRHYVAFNLIYLVIATFIALYLQFDQNHMLVEQAHRAAADGNLFVFYGKIILFTSLMLIGAIAVLLFFYWLIYGLLLRSLNRNYKELKKMEM